MSKLLAFTGLIVAGLVTILFIADLAAGFPFQRASLATDVGFVISGLIVAYLSWSLLAKA